MRPVGSKYLLEEPLGRGATGTVWRGRAREAADPADGTASRPGEVVAIKVLREELANDPDVVTRFLRERSVLLRLRHPSIVRLRDLVVEGDLLALVMDLINGPDLQRYVRENGPFSPMGAALLTAGVADALAVSHADGIVHRDLKPANVLLASNEDGSQMRPMLTDFGIARLADSPGVTRAHEFVGTPAYVAPESAEGREQTSAVDVYGAGILMYELVTGRPPFRGESALEVLHQHLSEEPRRPSTVPGPLWTVIERCLRKNPEERPSAVSLARALRVVGHGIGAHATPEAAEAALGVGALLLPDHDPARVPGTGAALSGLAAAPEGRTQVLPNRAGGAAAAAVGEVASAAAEAYGRTEQADPYAATSVLPYAVGGSGAQDGTRTLPSTPEPQPKRPQGPHPWESQLSAARGRNEQTEVGYLDPSLDPLRHRPRRPAVQAGQQAEFTQPPGQPAPQVQPAPPVRPQAYQRPGVRSPAGRQQPQPQPQPQRYEPRRPTEPEPVPRHERRPRSPMRIPGLGCLKGCMFMVLVIVVICVLVWNFTPLPEWVAQGRSWYEATSNSISAAWHWISSIGGIMHSASPHGVEGGHLRPQR